MSVYWKLTDEEAEELSGFLCAHYRKMTNRRSGADKASAETALKYYAGLAACVYRRDRNAEPGHLHDCPVTLNLDDEQYARLCALQTAMSSESPEAALEMAVGIGSKRLIDDRLRFMEWAFLKGVDAGKGESG